MQTKIKKNYLFILLLAIVSLGSLVFIIVGNKKELLPNPPVGIEPIEKVFQKSVLDTKTFVPFDSTQLINDNELLGFNKSSQISIFNNNEEQIVYGSPVRLFSYNNDRLVVLEKDTNIMTTINFLTKQKIYTVDSSQYQPIISVSLSVDGKSLYFLGKYNSETHESNLYMSPTASFNPILIISTKTTKIEALSNSTLLAYRYTDQPNASYVEIIDASSKKTAKQYLVDFYSISPSKEKIAISLLSKITVFDISNNQLVSPISVPAQKPSFVLWKDDVTLIVISNNDNRAIFFKYGLDKNNSNPEIIYTLDDDFIRSVVASSSKIIVVLNKYDKIFKINLF